MKNIVECKRCQAPFNYIPGPLCNAKQLCEKCQAISNKEEAYRMLDETVLEETNILLGHPAEKIYMILLKL